VQSPDGLTCSSSRRPRRTAGSSRGERQPAQESPALKVREEGKASPPRRGEDEGRLEQTAGPHPIPPVLTYPRAAKEPSARTRPGPRPPDETVRPEGGKRVVRSLHSEKSRAPPRPGVPSKGSSPQGGRPSKRMLNRAKKSRDSIMFVYTHDEAEREEATSGRDLPNTHTQAATGRGGSRLDRGRERVARMSR